jgi:hypothetical protein
VHCLDQRFGARLSGGMARIGRLSPDIPLDGVERGDAAKGFLGDRRAIIFGGIEEPAPDMRPAMRNVSPQTSTPISAPEAGRTGRTRLDSSIITGTNAA